MARIYDNSEMKFQERLQGIVTAPNVERVDFLSYILIYVGGILQAKLIKKQTEEQK